MKSFSIVTCYVLIISLLYSCNQQETKKLEAGNKWTPAPISFENLYTKHQIDNYLFNLEESANKDSIIKESKKLFLKGIDALKNKKDYEAAIKYTKNALSLYPEAKAYYELGNALLAIGNYNEAKSAFEEAIEFDFNPKAQLYYQIAFCLAKAESGNKYQIKEYLNLAIQNGLLHQPGFNQTALELFQHESWYASLVTDVPGLGSKEQLFFQSFVEGFEPENENGFELSANEVTMENAKKEFINYDFAQFVKEMENVSFGRDVSHEFFYLSQVHHTDEIIALVYGSEEISYGGMANIAYYMVTYTKEGKEIDKQLVGCNCSAEKIKSFKIKKNHVTVTEHSRIWEKNLQDVAIENNRVKNIIDEQQFHYVINEQGGIDEATNTIGLL